MTAGAGVLLRHQAEAGEDEGRRRGGEDLEEALDPEVDHPPAPVLHHRQVAAGAEEEAGGVHQADRRGRAREHQHQRAPGVAAPERRPEGAHHQGQPEDQPDEQADLPEAAEVDVLIALLAEPEAGVEAQALVDRQPLAGQRAGDDDQKGAEQDVDAEALEARLAATDRRRQEEPGGEEGGGDPEDRRLDVPGAGQAVGQPLGQRQAEERLALDGVVGGHRAEEDLDDEQPHDHAEVLGRRRASTASA